MNVFTAPSSLCTSHMPSSAGLRIASHTPHQPLCGNAGETVPREVEGATSLSTVNESIPSTMESTSAFKNGVRPEKTRA